MVVVEFFAWVFLLFSYRYGYLTMFKKFQFMQLKSPWEYLAIVKYGIEDVFSTVLTLVKILFDLLGFYYIWKKVVALLLFHVKKLFLFKPEPHKRKYLRFLIHLFGLSLLDWFTAVFWVVLFVFPWRLGHTKRLITQTMSASNNEAYTRENDLEKRSIVIVQAFATILELPLVLLFAILAVWHTVFKRFRIFKLLALADVTL